MKVHVCRRLLCLGIWGVCGFLPLGVQATVSLQLRAGELKTASGEPMPVAGLVLLVASTGDPHFGGPTEQSFVSGDDVVVYRGDLSNLNLPGQFNDFLAGLELEGGWTYGDPLALYWYPTLTLESTQPGPGVPYGFFTAAAGDERDGSDPWVTPGDGSTISLYFQNADALMPPLVSGGSYPASSGLASFTTPGGGGDPTDPGGPTDPQEPTRPWGPGQFGPLVGMTAIGGGVYHSTWLGHVYPLSEGWVYHYELGFLYLFGEDDEDLWYWDDRSQEFWWAHAGVFPFVFRHSNRTWYYFYGEEPNGERRFYNTSSPESPWEML